MAEKLFQSTSLIPIMPSVTERDLRSIDKMSFEKRFGRLHAVGSSMDERHGIEGITVHVCTTPLPPGSILMVKDGVGVTSVALTAILMARRLSDFDLVRLLYELCATYRVEDYYNLYVPLATVAGMKAEVKQLLSIRGAKRVFDLLDYVADNSRSPRETDLAMLAWLPCRLGGFHLPMGEMNKEKKLGEASRKCDLWFQKAKLGVEYESDEGHLGETNISRDSARRTLFGNKGYRVVTMTNGEFKDNELLFETMRLIGKYLGKRVHKPSGSGAKAREELLAFVRSPHVAFF